MSIYHNRQTLRSTKEEKKDNKRKNVEYIVKKMIKCSRKKKSSKVVKRCKFRHKQSTLYNKQSTLYNVLKIILKRLLVSSIIAKMHDSRKSRDFS